MEQDRSRIKLRLYNAMLAMRSGRASNIYWAMEDVGIRIAVSRFFDWKNGIWRVKKQRCR